MVFREVQRWRRWWLPLAGLVAFGVLDVTLIYAVTALSKAPTARDIESARAAAYAVMGATLGLGILLAFVARVMSLTTEVRADGLFVRYFPIHLSFKRIPLEDAVKCRAVTYSPLGQYGGWGIRYTWRGKAYNVSGNRGARIEYSNGRHLLIGSQRPEELCAAIKGILGETSG